MEIATTPKHFWLVKVYQIDINGEKTHVYNETFRTKPRALWLCRELMRKDGPVRWTGEVSKVMVNTSENL
jgi:hypothetical protein